MIIKLINRFTYFYFIISAITIICLVKPVFPQSAKSDSSYHPYHVNYWVTGGTILGGLALEKIGIDWLGKKSQISMGELENLNRADITNIDRWALRFDPSQRGYYDKLSNQLASVCPFLPLLTLFDKEIRRDWLDILFMYLQTQALTNNFYLYSPFGATFQNRFRPIVYYEEVSLPDRTTNNNRNSLYSGHVTSAAAASFFTAKIFCDYHPGLGWEKYLIYSAASIPPLLMAYFRLGALEHFPTDVLVGLGVGALCGILVPEFHRTDKALTLGLFSSPQATGIAVKWKPDF